MFRTDSIPFQLWKYWKICHLFGYQERKWNVFVFKRLEAYVGCFLIYFSF